MFRYPLKYSEHIPVALFKFYTNKFKNTINQFAQQRSIEIERAITSVSETLYRALIDEIGMVDGMLDGRVSIKRRLQWMFDQQTIAVKLLGGVHVAAWIIAITMVIDLIHRW